MPRRAAPGRGRPCLRRTRSAGVAAALLLALLLTGCANHTQTAIKAAVEQFYAGISVENKDAIEGSIAASAPASFHSRVVQTAQAAQHDPAVRASVRVVRVDAPVVHGNTARVRVHFEDGGTDDVSLVQEQGMWKVISTSRLG